jgi:hypothetical protein
MVCGCKRSVDQRHAGQPVAHDPGKRERETRRSSFSSELMSPVSSAKGGKRIPSHGVWALVAHRESWQSNLSSGIFRILHFTFEKKITVFVQRKHVQALDFICTY